MMKNLRTVAAAAAALTALVAVGCQTPDDKANKARYADCMRRAQAAGVLNDGTRVQIDAACQTQSQQQTEERR